MQYFITDTISFL